MATTRLKARGDEILSGVETVLTAWGVTLPPLRYVTVGAPPWDCELLVVECAGVWSGTTSAERVDPERGGPQSAEYRVHAVICVPTLDTTSGGKVVLPTEAALEASGEELLTLGEALRFGVLEAHGVGEFIPRCDRLGVGRMVPLERSGGFGGWVLTLRVGI